MCEECRHYPCRSDCPNYEPPVAYKCDGCGDDIHVGDTVYIVNLDKEYRYCEYCAYQTEAEAPELDEDFAYERWRDKQLMED